MNMSCKHKNNTVIKTTSYRGPIEDADEKNRAAHGGVRHLVRCDDCGMLQDVNSNGRHREAGPWYRGEAEGHTWR